MLRDYTGRGPTKARSVIDRDRVTILFADTLTPGERRLAEGGKVRAFVSGIHTDTDVSSEVFYLEPIPTA